MAGVTDTAHLYQYHEGDEERVVAAIAADPGISSAGLSEELGIAPEQLKELTAVLRKDRRAAFRSLPDEDGDLVVGWYPVPYEPRTAAPIPTPEPSKEADDLPESPTRPKKEKRTKCQYCGAEKETNVKRAGHERFCKLNPNRQLAPGERKKVPRETKRSADDVRSCPVAGCPSTFKGVHNRKSLINHLVRLHDIELGDAKAIADGRRTPPDIDTEANGVSKGSTSVSITNPVDADIIPPSEVECEGCDQLHDGECKQGEECVCNCATKMEQLQNEGLPEPESQDPVPSAAEELPECDGDTCRIGPLREDLPLPRPAPEPCEPLNTCTPLEVRHVTIPTTERPQDEPTPLARICSLAVEMEALAARHGYTARVDIDAYGERPKMQLSIRPKGVSE